MGIIENAKDIPLRAKQGFVPQMNGAAQNYFQPMTFIIVAKAISGGFLVESGTDLQSWTNPLDNTTIQGKMQDFNGVMYPYKPRELDIKAIGERAWTWWTLICNPQLQLQVDDALVYLGIQHYRVMAREDYSLYNYMSYKLVQDYDFSGPLQLVQNNQSPYTNDSGPVVLDSHGNEVLQ